MSSEVPLLRLRAPEYQAFLGEKGKDGREKGGELI